MRWLGRLLRALLCVAAGCILLTAAPVLALRWLNPPTSAFMLTARVQAWFDTDPRPFVIRQDWRNLAAISPQAALAVVASEDQQFPMHRGFDVAQIRRALAEAEDGGRARGASTITQQTAKNLFLWSGHSWLRKGLEAWFTVLMEAFLTKHRILEIYLNIIELGRGVYGVQAAAQLYFGHDARALGAGEAALLAAVLPSPRQMHVDRPGRYVQQRRAEILAQMHALGSSWLRGIL